MTWRSVAPEFAIIRNPDQKIALRRASPPRRTNISTATDAAAIGRRLRIGNQSLGALRIPTFGKGVGSVPLNRAVMRRRDDSEGKHAPRSAFIPGRLFQAAWPELK